MKECIDFCEQCGDCLDCDFPHYCEKCRRCRWDCVCEGALQYSQSLHRRAYSSSSPFYKQTIAVAQFEKEEKEKMKRNLTLREAIASGKRFRPIRHDVWTEFQFGSEIAVPNAALLDYELEPEPSTHEKIKHFFMAFNCWGNEREWSETYYNKATKTVTIEFGKHGYQDVDVVMWAVTFDKETLETILAKFPKEEGHGL